MEAVGYDLYCKMLNEAVKEAKGENVEESFETSVDITTNAYIPVTYVANEVQKLDIYKRIAGVETEDEAEEMLEEPVQNLLMIARLKFLAHSLYIKEITQKGNELKLVMYEKAKVNPTEIPRLISDCQPYLQFTADTKNPYFTYRLNANSRQKGKDIIETLKELLVKMSILALKQENPC